MINRLKMVSTCAVSFLLLVSLAACGDPTATTAPAATTAAASGVTTVATGATTAASASGATTVANAAPSGDTVALYEAAKKEGKLVWYTVWFNQDVVNDIGTAFSAKYPGLKVEGTRNVAATMYQKLTQEMQAGIKNVDIYGTTDMGQMIELKEQGKLTAYTPEGKDAIIADYRSLDPENFYHTGSLSPLLITYNTQKAKAEDLPKSWQDLISDKNKDKISTGSAAASGQVGTWALSMQQKYGWEAYFNKLNGLNPKLGRSINDTVVDIVSGERSLAIGPMGQVLASKAKGNPVDVIYPSDGTIVVVNPVGILKDAPHPATAKLFMNFLMSKEYAELCAKNYEQPLRSDVTISVAKTLKEIPTYSPKPADIRKDLPDIIKKWKTVFGA